MLFRLYAVGVVADWTAEKFELGERNIVGFGGVASVTRSMFTTRNCYYIL